MLGTVDVSVIGREFCVVDCYAPHHDLVGVCTSECIHTDGTRSVHLDFGCEEVLYHESVIIEVTA